MNSNLTNYKEAEYLKPLDIPDKELYLADITNIEHSWTGRQDAMIANTFFLESVRLMVNAISLFEKGYFDCAFYSLRQSIEVSTTIIYLVDDDDENRKIELHKWKSKSRFPMYNQMLKLLDERKAIFADVKYKMSAYFQELEQTKKALNKYVHKQGFDTFYVSKNHPINGSKDNTPFINEFQSYLEKCIGAIAVFRLAIDPLPVMLNHDEIFHRTGDLLTVPYSNEFIKKYIGIRHITSYKETVLYTEYYDSIIKEEVKEPFVTDVVKDNYIDRKKLDGILAQRHLLNKYDLVAVVLVGLSEKVARIYCIGGFKMYFTSTKPVRKSLMWSSEDFNIFESSAKKFNLQYGEAFISCLTIYDDEFYMEHNEMFTSAEITIYKQWCTIANGAE